MIMPFKICDKTAVLNHHFPSSIRTLTPLSRSPLRTLTPFSRFLFLLQTPLSRFPPRGGWSG